MGLYRTRTKEKDEKKTTSAMALYRARMNPEKYGDEASRDDEFNAWLEQGQKLAKQPASESQISQYLDAGSRLRDHFMATKARTDKVYGAGTTDKIIDTIFKNSQALGGLRQQQRNQRAAQNQLAKPEAQEYLRLRDYDIPAGRRVEADRQATLDAARKNATPTISGLTGMPSSGAQAQSASQRVKAAQDAVWEQQSQIRKAEAVQAPLRYEPYRSAPGFADAPEAELPRPNVWDYTSDIQGGLERKTLAQDYITPEERQMYNYVYQTKGQEEAEKYLDILRDQFAMRSGEKKAEWAGDSALKQLSVAVEGGLGTAGANLRQALTGEQLPLSRAAAMQSATRENIDGAMGTVFDITSTVANMAPSIAAGALYGPGVGAGLMGVQAYGGAYGEQLREGYSPEQARMYGVLVGASEAGLSYLLGGIGKVGGMLTGNIAKNTIAKIDNAILRTALTLGVKGAGEFSEEYMQEILDPVWRNLVLGENNEFKIFTDEALYAGILGAVTAGMLELPGAIHTEASAPRVGVGIRESGKYEALMSRALSFDQSTVVYNFANSLQNAEPTDAQIGRLAQMYKESGGDLSFLYAAPQQEAQAGPAQVEPAPVAPEQSSIVAQLTEAGMPVYEARRQAQTIATILRGETPSGNKAAELARSPEALAVLSRYTGQEINTDAPISQVRASVQGLANPSAAAASPPLVGEAGMARAVPTVKDSLSVADLRTPDLAASDTQAMADMADTLGPVGGRTLQRMYNPDVAAADYYPAFVQQYEAARNGREAPADSVLTPPQIEAAREAGAADADVTRDVRVTERDESVPAPTGKAAVFEAARALGEDSRGAVALYEQYDPAQDAGTYIDEMTRYYEAGLARATYAPGTDDMITEEQALSAYEAGWDDANSIEGSETNGGEEANAGGAGRQARKSGVAAGGPASEVSTGQRTGPENGAQRARAEDLRRAVKAAGVVAESTAAQGISAGTTRKGMYITPAKLWSDTERAVSRKMAKLGVQVIYFTGDMEIRENGVVGTARGAVSADGKRMWIKADHPFLTVEQIAAHEEYHLLARTDKNLVQETRKMLLTKFSNEDLNALIGVYMDEYGLFNKSDDEILEEILADAYAGIEVNIPTLQFSEVARERAAQVERGAAEQFSYEGRDPETGRGIYRSNFPKGTPKLAKSEKILQYIQDVWSQKPIRLVLHENGADRVIYAQFDPAYDPKVASDATKLMIGNRHGSYSDQRVTLDLADDYYQIASESVYNYSKGEEGKTSATHRGVRQWHYFINDILFREYEGDNTTPYRVTVNVKERTDGHFVYSFSAEKQKTNEHPPEIQSGVSGKAADVRSKSRVPQEESSVKDFTEKEQFSLEEPVESTRDLIAVHNLTPTNLRDALELGGLAMPSIAVTRAELGQPNFGPISLIFGRNTVDPSADKRNRLYGGDAYTPIFPEVGYKLDEKKTQALYRWGRDVAKEHGLPSETWTFLYDTNITDRLEWHGGDFIKAYRDHNDMRLLYAADTIPDFDPVLREDGKYDHYATQADIKSKIEQEAYEAWLAEKADGLVLKRGLRNKNDPYTPSGRRRSFEQLYNDYTIDNAVAMMARERPAGTGGWGDVASFAGAAAKTYKSIEDARADRARLQRLSEYGMSNIRDEFGNRIDELARKLVSNRPDPNDFRTISDAAEAMAEAVQKSKSVAGIYRYLKKWPDMFTVTTETAEEIATLAREIAETPRDYFEAKPARAVPFSEVLAAVIPDNIDRKLEADLEAAGIPLIMYAHNFEADRLDAINSVEGAQFSREERPEVWALREENELLAEKVEYWKRESKLTERAELRPADVRKLANSLRKEYESTAATDELSADLKTLGELIANDGSWTEIRERADAIASTIVENASALQDPSGQEFRDEMRKWIRKLRIKVPTELQADIPDYKDFRKANFGRFVLARDGQSIDSAFEDLRGMFGEAYFPSSITAESDQLQYLAELAGTLRPVRENPYRGAMRETVGFVSNEIIDRLIGDEVRQLPATAMDKAEQSRASAVLRERDRAAAALDRAEQSRASAVLKERDRAATALDKAEQSRASAVQRERQKTDAANARTARVRAEKNARIKEIRQAAKEKFQSAMKQERQRRIDAVDRLKKKYTAEKAADREARTAQRLRGQIMRHASALSQKLLKPSDKKHIPQELRTAVATLMGAINLESAAPRRTNLPKSVGAKQLGRKTKLRPLNTQRTEAFNAVRQQYRKIASEAPDTLVIDPDLMENIEAVIAMGDVRIAEMNSQQLTTVWQALKAIEASVSNANKLLAMSRYESVAEAANEIRGALEARKTKQEHGGWKYPVKLTQDLMFQSLRPVDFMHRLGDGGDAMFLAMRRAEDQNIRLLSEAQQANAEAFKGVNVRKIMEAAPKTFEVGGKTLQLTTGQIMDLYLLMKRPQAQGHVLGDGIRPAPILGKDGNVTRATEPVHVTEEDVTRIVNSLTAEQKILADHMGKYASTTLASWGNKASMDAYGYEKFTEENYWPINTDPNRRRGGVPGETGKLQAVATKNMGFTKETVPKAKNAIVLEDAFSVFAQHTAQMAWYSAWLTTIEDTQRVYNYLYRDEEGQVVGSVREDLGRVFGDRGKAYLDLLIKDIDQGTGGERDATSLGKLTSNYKAAAVGANVRVILQQPTAFFRAGAVIDNRYLLAALRPGRRKGTWDLIKKYAPIATWKDWGYFDRDAGRSVRDVLLSTDSNLDKLKEAAMAPAAKADSITWSALWRAAEAEIRHKRRDLTRRSEAFYEAVAERFNEIIDRTQVVDSLLQRDQMRRSTNSLVRMATSFMSEPITAYSMLARAHDDLVIGAPGAKRQMARTIVGLVLAGVANAAARALSDAARDDDKKRAYWEKWLASFTGFSGDEQGAMDYLGAALFGNLGSELNVVAKLPYFNDLFSIFQGYDIERMDMSAIARLVQTGSRGIGVIGGSGKMTFGAWLADFLAQASGVLGLPVANIKRDVMSGVSTGLAASDNWVGMYEYEKLLYPPTAAPGRYYDTLYAAWQTDKWQYEQIRRNLIRDGLEDSKIESGLRARIKKSGDFGAASDKAESGVTKDLQGRAAFKKLPAQQKDKALEMASDYAYAKAMDKANPDYEFKGQYAFVEKIEAGRPVGISPAEYILYDLAYDMATADKNADGESIPGSKQAKVIDALNGMSWLTDAEKAYLFGTSYKDSPNNPY
jgi:Mg2+/Co2+ transporter CorC